MAKGVRIVRERIAHIDPVAGKALGRQGHSYRFDKVVLSPGIRVRKAAIDGYDDEAARLMPHGWDGGDGTAALESRIESMADGGTVLLAMTTGAARFPEGLYRRATEIAAYLRRFKPRSKVLILDGTEGGANSARYRKHWRDRFPAGMVEWIPASQGGAVTAIGAPGRELIGPAGRFTGDVVSLIPPQEAGALAHICGVADRGGWCPTDPITAQSLLAPGVFVAGDAADVTGEGRDGETAVRQGRRAAWSILSERGGSV